MIIDIFNFDNDFQECMVIARENLRDDDTQDVYKDFFDYLNGGSKNPKIFVVKDLDKIMAFGSYCEFPNAPAFWICWMNVKKSCQKRGYGKFLTEYMLSEIKNITKNKILLSTYDKTKFYEKFGFKKVGNENGEDVMVL